MPPPPSFPFKQWENTFGVMPCEASWEMTDISCCPNPKIPLTALSDFVKSPVCNVLHPKTIEAEDLLVRDPSPIVSKCNKSET
uniref:Uncharacterized protein MANES_11G154800 n=1 Tax=Rhizophora mucronata TaxID=61149 RepID=A0A2P2K3K6_RHIMU